MRCCVCLCAMYHSSAIPGAEPATTKRNTHDTNTAVACTQPFFFTYLVQSHLLPCTSICAKSALASLHRRAQSCENYPFPSTIVKIHSLYTSGEPSLSLSLKLTVCTRVVSLPSLFRTHSLYASNEPSLSLSNSQFVHKW